MATHSSILAWRISRMEESGRLRSSVEKSRTGLKQFSTHTHYWVQLLYSAVLLSSVQ